MRSLFSWAFVLAPAAQPLFCSALPLDSHNADDETGAAVGGCLLQSSSHSHKSKSALEAVVEALVEDAAHVVEDKTAETETLLTGSSAIEDTEVELAAASGSETNGTVKASADGSAADAEAVEGPQAVKDVGPALLEMEGGERQKAEHERQAFALHAAELARQNQTFEIGESGLRLQIGTVPERSFFTVEGKDCLHPVHGDQLLVHYTGTLKDGSVFDSSHRRGEPFKFTIGEGRVLKGWDEGLLSMCLGERGSLHVPSAFAYGQRGALPRIPKDADLDFDVELLAINDVSASQYHRPKIHWPMGGGAARTSGSLLCAALSLLAATLRA